MCYVISVFVYGLLSFRKLTLCIFFQLFYRLSKLPRARGKDHRHTIE
ncbi:hypothetical protein F383_25540 [Gossypium arboreum]|uniref:Uncharacterized protein n=1 Tax=Gossypium arboreum TaxID=29729 RepID=A0A0B0MV70_GOSAR|nr:hypothetical protein F383_25540 [Gossypium arboreum]